MLNNHDHDTWILEKEIIGIDSLLPNIMILKMSITLLNYSNSNH